MIMARWGQSTRAHTHTHTHTRSLELRDKSSPLTMQETLQRQRCSSPPRQMLKETRVGDCMSQAWGHRPGLAAGDWRKHGAAGSPGN